MLEIVFNESAAASLAIAKNSLWKIKKRSPKVLPIETENEDICCFPLFLCFGQINEDGIGPLREAALATLMSAYPKEGPDAVKEMLETARQSLEKLLSRAKKREPLRIWTSRQPDDTCGLFWLMEQLLPIGLDRLNITIVMLPDFSELPGGSAVLHCGWGGVVPQAWGGLAKLGKRLPSSLSDSMAKFWQELRTQNTALRSIFNHQLLGAQETLYDSLILWELEKEPEEFSEAHFVGKLIGQYRTGMSEAFFALRLEQFIQDGILQEVSSPAPGEPSYHRILRKAGAGSQEIE